MRGDRPSTRASMSGRVARLRDGHWAATAAVGVLALVLRLAYWWSTRSSPLQSDAGQYHEIATNLADGRGFAHTFPGLEIHATAFRPPVFPALLGLVYRVTGSSQGVARAFAVLLGVVLVVVLHRVLRHHVSDRVALVAAALVACYPPLVANDTVPLTESLSLVLLVLLVDQVARERWAWAGGLCGVLILTRPSAQGLVVVLGVALWVLVGWKRALASVAIVLAVVSPWVVRNAVQVGTWNIVTSNGFNIAALYSEEAQQRGAFIDPVYHPGFDDIRILQFDEAEWSAELQRRGLENIREDPSQVLHVLARNAEAHFELDPSLNENAERIDGRNMDVRAATLWTFYVVSIAGIVGWWLGRRIRYVSMLAVTAVYFALTSLVFVAPPRLRAPFDLACCVGTAIVIDRVVTWARQRRSGGAGGGPDGGVEDVPAVGAPR